MAEGAKNAAQLACPAPLPGGETILLGHGSGGRLTEELIHELFLPAFRSPALARLDDQAIVSVNGCRLAFTTDSFVVKPLFFAGGDIGSLAVHGTINDLAMGGARPLFLSAAFILEEGFAIAELKRIVTSFQEAALAAEVEIVTGDTKVVQRGSGDGVFINTSGIGLAPKELTLSANQARPGDQVLLSGPIGDHGMAVMAAREGLELESTIRSDSAALHGLVAEMLKATRQIRCMRDPTRGGLASALNEIAQRSEVGIELDEVSIPVRQEVQAACEILGLDPMYVANEGKLVAIVAAEAAGYLLQAMRRHPLGREARVIGTVKREHSGLVTMRTVLGTTRIVDMLTGDQLPRIC